MNSFDDGGEPDWESSIEMARKQAREWLIFFDSNLDFDQSDSDRFERWLNLDVANKKAFEDIKGFWSGLDEVSDLKELEEYTLPAGLSVLSNIFNTIRKALFTPAAGYSLGALALSTVFVVFMTFDVNDDVTQGGYKTDIAKIGNVSLPDGSEVTLSPFSEISWRFSNRNRTVELISGEAYFVVSSNKDKPFLVLVDHVSVRVVGTVFSVNKYDDETTVSVEEGVVSVEHKIEQNKVESAVILKKGDRVSASSKGKFGTVEKVDADSVGAWWKSGVRVYEDEPLKNVVRDLIRYSNLEITMEPGDINDIPITATIPQDKFSQFLVYIEATYPLKVIKTKDGKITIQSK